MFLPWWLEVHIGLGTTVLGCFPLWSHGGLGIVLHLWGGVILGWMAFVVVLGEVLGSSLLVLLLGGVVCSRGSASP